MGQILLIRHGQASWGKRDYDQLSKQGEVQSRLLGESLRDRKITPDRIIVGGMKRHQQTAEFCLRGMEIEGHELQVDHSFREYDHEEIIWRQKPLYRSRLLMAADLALSRKPQQTFQKVFEQAMDRWTSGIHLDYNESHERFCQRTHDGLDNLLSDAQGTTLVFTSGGVISASVMRLWNLPTSEWTKLNKVIANASITKIVVGRSGSHLVSVNDHSHFEGAHQMILSYR